MSKVFRCGKGQWLAFTATAFLVACASPYSMTRDIDERNGLSVGDGVRLAAKAMLAVGYFPTQQNDAAGRVLGERNDKDSFGTDVLTLFIEASVARTPKGSLQLNTTCSVSGNIVYTDVLDDECEKFQRAFDKLLAERGAVLPAARPPSAARPAIPTPVPLPVPAPTRGKAYSL